MRTSPNDGKTTSRWIHVMCFVLFLALQGSCSEEKEQKKHVGPLRSLEKKESNKQIASAGSSEEKGQNKHEGLVSSFEIDQDRRKGDFGALHKAIQRLAHQGNPKAEFELGLMYYQGTIEKDYSKAMHWLTKAANHGHTDAMSVLAEMYQKGRGVPINESKAVKLDRQAAQLGKVFSQNTMGVRYAKGRGVPIDLSKSALWFERSAEQGYRRAQLNIGISYRDGQGVDRNLVVALKWFLIANQWRPGADYSDMADAAKLAANLKLAMTSPQIEEAERLKSEWVPPGWRK